MQILDASTGPRGLLVVSIRIETMALWMRSTVRAYELVDEATAAALELGQDAAGFVVGAALRTALVGLTGLAVGGGTVVIAGAAVAAPVVVAGAALGHFGRTGIDLVRDAAAGRIPWSDVADRLSELSIEESVTGGLEDLQGAWDDAEVERWLADFGGELGESALGALDETLFEQPWITDTLAGGSEGLLTGFLGPFGPVAGINAGQGWPPQTYEDAIAAIIGIGNMGGYFEDGEGFTAEPIPLLDGEDSVIPVSIESIFRGQNQLMPAAGVDDVQSDPSAGRVRVIEVPQPDGSSAWIVQIPGTQAWPAQAGPNLLDATSNLHLMAGNQTVSRDAVSSALQQAMAAADAPPGQPVMLTGHSQGGITAAALAADPSFAEEFNVTHIVTGGSPVARFDIPAAVQILSIEHDQDPIPRLEGEANPERSSWITVNRDVSDVMSEPSAFGSHSGRLYSDTGMRVDASEDVSVRSYLEGAQPFFLGGANVRDYSARRRP